METYFLSESHIKLWLDQLIEKIAAVSHLEESQSEYSLEFEEGRKLVENITGLLTNTSSLPPSRVFEPIIFLIEQRLQGQRIDELTNFNKVMEAMVSEGIALVSGELNIEPEAIPAMASSANQDFAEIPQSIPAMIISNSTETGTSTVPPEETSPLQINEETIQNNSFPVIESAEINDSSTIPIETTRLAYILKEIFPDSQAQWDIKLGEYNFLVQVENLLIYLETLAEGENIKEEMSKLGWCVLVCNKEDLAFPRRLKRAICRIIKF